MTNEEAIKFLREMQHEAVSEAELYCASAIYGKGNMVFPEPEDYAIETAIEALEKQTPKKPYYEGDGYDKDGEIVYDTWRCPNCDEKYEYDYDIYDHCPNCGQKIDWSEEGEQNAENNT